SAGMPRHRGGMLTRRPRNWTRGALRLIDRGPVSQQAPHRGDGGVECVVAEIRRGHDHGLAVDQAGCGTRRATESPRRRQSVIPTLDGQPGLLAAGPFCSLTSDWSARLSVSVIAIVAGVSQGSLSAVASVPMLAPEAR